MNTDGHRWEGLRDDLGGLLDWMVGQEDRVTEFMGRVRSAERYADQMARGVSKQGEAVLGRGLWMLLEQVRTDAEACGALALVDRVKVIETKGVLRGEL